VINECVPLITEVHVYL